LQRSVAFDEWKNEEEGLPLQRVWIRIYRLPQKLREFFVLWALGSMLGATQAVDMISSLRTDYGHVEVAVLNVDLLPGSIEWKATEMTRQMIQIWRLMMETVVQALGKGKILKKKVTMEQFMRRKRATLLKTQHRKTVPPNNGTHAAVETVEGGTIWQDSVHGNVMTTNIEFQTGNSLNSSQEIPFSNAPVHTSRKLSSISLTLVHNAAASSKPTCPKSKLDGNNG
jgi:hypothetical protein